MQVELQITVNNQIFLPQLVTDVAVYRGQTAERRHATRHSDTRHNDTQHDVTQHNIMLSSAIKTVTLNGVMLSALVPSGRVERRIRATV